MVKLSTIRLNFVLALFLIPCCLTSQVQDSQQPPTAKVFVEQFYGWYVSQALSNDTNTPWIIAIEHRKADFSPRLVRLLTENSAAQQKCDELVGLDFDPFLNTQDPEYKYEVGEVRKKGNDYWAEIYGVRSGKRLETPALTAELSNENGHWHFVDFHYSHPSKTDLVAILKSRPPCSVPAGGPGAIPLSCPQEMGAPGPRRVKFREMLYGLSRDMVYTFLGGFGLSMNRSTIVERFIDGSSSRMRVLQK